MKGLVVAATLALRMPVLARAEVAEGVGDATFSIGPRASYYNPQGGDNGNWHGGAQARFHFTPVLAAEGSIDYRKSDFGEGSTIQGFPIQASLMADLTPHSRLSPFLLGGGGWYYTRVRGATVTTNTENQFGLHAGGGLEVLLTKSLSVDGSDRYIRLEDRVIHETNVV
ncbi:MAG: porin family protein [Elusimicrobia bacterium]|mgnify:CR=1 FL=1|nr:porin family protein [Elusimicrobiota bacterium]MBK7208442.1 porin family protein [Elusimicrobiota bacterium]MBK7545202.1 porin family protein [Elusimicrobiota bacterium]MBK7574724.1 porin family protein [Elusimicrobiota bacterium]MBK7688703.1 porin family protein [Elusimicrobiota bacterium]